MSESRLVEALRVADRTFAENGLLACHAARIEIREALAAAEAQPRVECEANYTTLEVQPADEPKPLTTMNDYDEALISRLANCRAMASERLPTVDVDAIDDAIYRLRAMALTDEQIDNAWLFRECPRVDILPQIRHVVRKLLNV